MARPTLPRPEVTRYVLFDRIGSGGMASVHVARLLGPAGFSRTVAVKRLLPHLATDDRFVAMLLDEARIAARVCHPCVVSVLDLVNENHELLLVMDYVHGEALSRLVRAAEGAGVPPPPAVASAILVSALLGLHAAHEATSADGAPLGIVHRDVSPQNILVAADGIARVADFGIAMASARLQVTTPGELKGKLAYMAPEQALGSAVDRRADLYSAGVILWELLTGRRMFPAGELDRLLARARPEPVDPPSRYSDRIAPEVDHVVMRALARAPENRFATAKELARALEVALPPASAVTVGEWVESACGEALAVRARRIADIELSTEPDIELIPLTTQVGVSPAALDPCELPFTPSARPGTAGSIEWTRAIVPVAAVGPSPAAPAGASEPAPRRASRASYLAPLAIACGVVGVLIVWQFRGASPSSPVSSATAGSSGGTIPSGALRENASGAARAVASLPSAAPTTQPPRASTSAKVTPRKAKCDPPFSVDSEGVRRYKPECLQ